MSEAVGWMRRKADRLAAIRELKRRGDAALLWQEHLGACDGYSYTRFCELYADWRKHGRTMRQTHVAARSCLSTAGDNCGRDRHRKSGVRASSSRLGLNFTSRRRAGARRCDWIGAHVCACGDRRVPRARCRQSQGGITRSRYERHQSDTRTWDHYGCVCCDAHRTRTRESESRCKWSAVREAGKSWVCAFRCSGIERPSPALGDVRRGARQFLGRICYFRSGNRRL